MLEMYLSIPIAAVSIGLVVGVMYLIFGNGLAFRIFAVVEPLLGVAAIAGVLSERVELDATGIAIMGVVVTAVSTGGQYWLYRIVVTRLGNEVKVMTSSVADLYGAAQASSVVAAQQAAAATEVASATMEIDAVAGTTASAARSVVAVTSEAFEQGRRGQEAVRDALQAMTRLVEVQEVVEVMSDLADQSNILAVNASIEAAQAGEHGAGFSVVASEVRSLSTQSKSAATKIREAIQKSDEARASLREVSDLIDRLASVLEEAGDKARTISAAAEQQSVGIRQISESVSSVADGSRDTATSAEQLKQTVGELESASQRVSRFVFARQVATPAAGGQAGRPRLSA